MAKTKTKKYAFLFIISILAGFFLSGIDYFISPEFASVLNSGPTRNVTPTEKYAYTLVSKNDKILHLKPGTENNIELKIKNSGKLSWNIPASDSKATTSIDFGESYKAKFTLQAAESPGFYSKTIKPFIPDPDWKINNKINLGIIVDGDFDDSYKFEIENPQALQLMRKVTRPITIKIKNTGKISWVNYGQFPIQLLAENKIVAADFEPNDDSWLTDNVIATMVESEIAPGQVATFAFKMSAPANIADYEFKFNLAIRDAYVFKEPFILGINVLTKKVALTFDDGYGNIDSFINLLNREHVRGTFFMLGCVAEQQQDAMRRIVNEGHLLANHSYCHPDFRTLSDDQIRWQLNRTREIMKDVSGFDIYPYFRYPYGAMNARTNEILSEEGWTYFPWTQSTDDYHYHQNTEAGRNYIYRYATLNPPDNAIVLMHIISQSSLAILPDIIQWYRDHDYTFVTVDEL